MLTFLSTLLVAPLSVRGEETAPDPVEMAEQYAQEASVSADMALNALENAHADRNKAEQDLVVVLREWDRDRIRAARVVLGQAEEGAKEAMTMVEEVLGCAARARDAALSVREQVVAGELARSSWGRRRALRRAARRATEAGRQAAIASSLCGKLKARWLVPAAITENGGSGEGSE